MISNVRITRIETDVDHGTFGVLSIDGRAFCVTLEPYWQFNQQNLSCIPAGQYSVEPFQSSKYGRVYMIRAVPGRKAVEFHSGNVDDHTRGCILLGEYFGKLRGNRAVLNSGATFKAFRDEIGWVRFHLTIVEAY